MTAPAATDDAPAPTSLRAAISGLFPGYFALVMATGIIAIAAEQQGHHNIAGVLYGIAAVGYVVLSLMLIARLVLYPRRVVRDLVDHVRGFAFLTVVAGTNVLGSASGIVHGWWGLAWGLWWASLVLWALIIYGALFPAVMGSDKPDLGHGINGTWFLLTVATQSVAVLGALLYLQHESDALAFASLAMFTLGLVLYLIVMTMVFLRWTFHPLDPTEVSPPAWIAAGAVAITVLAGSNIVDLAESSERVARLEPFVEGMVVLAWATATFWFPLMVAIGVWRHLVRRLPIVYHPSYWAMVFPLGMYAASTYKMIHVTDIDFLDWLPELTLVVALVAWTASFWGLLRVLARSAPSLRSGTARR